MLPETPRVSGGQTTSRPKIGIVSRVFDYFGRFFRELSLQAESDPGDGKYCIFVPSLGLPKATGRVKSSSSTAEKKALRRDSLKPYNIKEKLPLQIR